MQAVHIDSSEGAAPHVCERELGMKMGFREGAGDRRGSTTSAAWCGLRRPDCAEKLHKIQVRCESGPNTSKAAWSTTGGDELKSWQRLELDGEPLPPDATARDAEA